MIYLHYKDTKTFGHSFSFLLIFKTLRASYLQVGNFSNLILLITLTPSYLNKEGLLFSPTPSPFKGNVFLPFDSIEDVAVERKDNLILLIHKIFVYLEK